MNWSSRSVLCALILAGAYGQMSHKQFPASFLQDAQPPAPAAQAPATSESVNPTPRKDGWWTSRHDAMNARVAQGDVGVVFIGDSITQGWEGEGKDAWQKHFGDLKAVNLGIGGDQTQHVLWRMRNGNLKGIQPKVAVVMIGTNNTGTGGAPNDTAAGVRAILDELRSQCPKMKILLLAVFPRGETAGDPLRLANDNVNMLISKFADGTNIVWLDLGPKFLGAEGKLDRAVMPDLLHLSPAAYETWAVEVEPKIRALAAN